jgi:hypothetical protein
MNKVINAKYIYECDLKQFFPSIAHLIIENRLTSVDLPEYIVQWIDGINCSIPKLPKKHLIDESLVLEKEKDLKYNPLHYHNSLLPNMDDLSELFETLGDPITGLSYGVAQGSPISPLISILGLDQFLTQRPSVSYADDPIFYKDNDFKVRGRKAMGIVINEEKSF